MVTDGAGPGLSGFFEVEDTCTGVFWSVVEVSVVRVWLRDELLRVIDFLSGPSAARDPGSTLLAQTARQRRCEGLQSIVKTPEPVPIDFRNGPS